MEQACTICGGQGGGSMLPCLSCQRCTHDQCDSAYLHKIRGGKGACPPYACPSCRSGVEAMGIQALARANQLEGHLQQGLAVARAPRSSLDIFLADHRKLRQGKDGEQATDEQGGAEVVLMQKWERLRSKERQEYEGRARSEAAACQSLAVRLLSIHKEYTQLCACLGQVPNKALAPSAELCIAAGVPVDDVQQACPPPQQQQGGSSKRADHEDGYAERPQDKRRRTGGVASTPGPSSMDGAMLLAQASSRLATEQQQQQQQQQSTVGNGGSSSKRPSSDGAHGMPTALQQQQQLPSQQRGVLYPPGVVVDGTDDEAEGSEADGEGKQAEAAPAPAPPVATNQFGILPANSMQDLPAQMPVSCSGILGTFMLQGIKVICNCRACASQPPQSREFHPTHWESHCGAGAAKKWKASIKIEPGGIPELPTYMSNMPIGRYFDMKGVEFRPARTLGGPPVLDFVGSSLNREKTSGLGGLGPRGGSLAGVKRTVKAPSLGVYAKPYGNSFSSGGGYYAGDFKPFLPWAPWDDVRNGNYVPIKVRWAGDRCCVCDSDVDYDIDQLVSCDGCGITCHQSCYGIPEVPGPDDIWLCRTCELKEKGEDDVKQCCLCPIVGGALKPTTLEGGQWCHAACMQWIPEVTCLDPMCMEPIDRIQAIQKERWELQCNVCKQRMGAKIQCTSCYTAYHPLCARMAGLQMEMVEPPPGVVDAGLQIISYCPKHCRPQPHLSGVQPLRDSGGGAFGDGSGLWNAQPFPIPPAVSTPQCPAGCARAQALINWERERHGTGAGCTTVQGFWMPGQDAPLAPGGGPFAGGFGGFGMWGEDWVRPRGVGRPRGSRGRGAVGRPRIHPIGGIGRPMAGMAANMPPPKVSLLPLPEDTPETLPIVCAGRYGELLLRTQRVMHEGEAMTASRFEQLCGRGDAKKWKNSFWLVNSAGQPECMIQDWLGARGLDRARLAILASNAMQVEAYEEWLENKDKEGTPGEGGAEMTSEQQALQVLDALKGAQQQQQQQHKFCWWKGERQGNVCSCC
uniref:PHD-type domain-containing protein n=1 Tax=Dunaliella tertiolecta TaxID=3047 RepID=A0A7S3R019_DUNTE